MKFDALLAKTEHLYVRTIFLANSSGIGQDIGSIDQSLVHTNNIKQFF